MNGKGKYSEFGGVEGGSGRRSFNILDNKCYFFHNRKPVLQDSCLLLSNPHSGPASALAPAPILPCASPVDNKDMVPPQPMTTQKRPPSPTSVILNPLVGSWVPPTLIPAARLRAPVPSASDTPPHQVHLRPFGKAITLVTPVSKSRPS